MSFNTNDTNNNTKTRTEASTEQLKSPRPLRRIPARMQLKPTPNPTSTTTHSDGSSTETERQAPADGEQILYTRPFGEEIEVSDSDNNTTTDTNSLMSCTSENFSYTHGTTYEECGGMPLDDYSYRDEDRPGNRFGFVSKRSFCAGSCCSRKSSMSSLCSQEGSAYSADQSDMDVDDPAEMEL
ncbi:hypothetical protein V5O48_016409 [Marasmius crinis-equi]|uniref:Uncharacterized protein n=1 Tax=Marasmius crinis-equi TaxID=585013 RepID=A0ABR3ERV2_9AGAR